MEWPRGKADKPLGLGNPLFSRATLRAWPSMAINSVELRNPIPISKFPRKSCLMSSLRTSFSSAIDVEFSTDDLPLRLRKQRKIWIMSLRKVEMEDLVMESVPDIYSSDLENLLAVVEYVEDIHNFYKRAELKLCPLFMYACCSALCHA